MTRTANILTTTAATASHTETAPAAPSPAAAAPTANNRHNVELTAAAPTTSASAMTQALAAGQLHHFRQLHEAMRQDGVGWAPYAIATRQHISRAQHHGHALNGHTPS